MSGPIAIEYVLVSALLEEFRKTPNAVLLATSSFWQGVDVMGEALSCVIIDKLPFASPGDPITAARIEAIADRGGQPFGEYQVPLAILTSFDTEPGEAVAIVTTAGYFAAAAAAAWVGSVRRWRWWVRWGLYAALAVLLTVSLMAVAIAYDVE